MQNIIMLSVLNCGFFCAKYNKKSNKLKGGCESQ